MANPEFYSNEDLELHKCEANVQPRPASFVTQCSRQDRAWYNPRGWSRCTKVIVGAGIACITAGVVVGAVFGSKMTHGNRYPDYSQLKYSLVDDYSGRNFFDGFGYFTEDDPTGGFVKYVDRSTARHLNLTYASDASAVLKVDTVTKNAPHGRQSVRIYSKSTYNEGLFVFDVIHAPYGCGTWPALWLTDERNWPKNGEIDIIEGNNLNTENGVTLHSTAGCTMEGRRIQSGTPTYAECDDTHGNAGCGVTGETNSYGEGLNYVGGGVYALEMRNAGIRTWFFPRKSIPDEIADYSPHPDPSTWGTPLADFPNTDCDIPKHFTNQSIIVNIDLCGEQGADPLFYKELYDCPATCETFVATNPEAFEEAYWEFAGMRIYQAI